MFEHHSLAERVMSILLMCAMIGSVLAIVSAVLPLVLDVADQAGAASGG